ncbi:MAG: radical SAM protein, partial [Chloroflexota bacterium]
QPPDPASYPDLLTALERGALFDSQAARCDAKQFNRLYRPIGILPPDQYLALVLQATEGCSFSTCTFCDLYHQDFRVKPLSEFRQHIADVREYMGESMSLRGQSVFLGAANALAVPMPRLLPLLEAISDSFEAPIHAFVDGFTGKRKTADDYRALAALGLRRVYVGLESGHDPLLDFVRKPGRSADAVETVREIKGAGVNVGVIVMIGLGGDKYAEGHVADTVAALNAMQLGAGDLLYFSDLVEEPGTLYPMLAASHAIRPLTPGERTAQRQTIREQLVFAGSPPKISNYDIREFVY